MSKTGLRVGAVLILIALAPFAYVQIRLHSHNWLPLTAPVRLDAGKEVGTSEFVTDLSGSYVVSLDFTPNNPALEECLVGDSLFKDDCTSLGSGLDLDWSVLSGDSNKVKAVVDRQAYRPQGFGGAGVVSTVLGDFDAKEGNRYRILLHVKNVAPELISASPKIRVEAHRIYWEKWIIYSQASLLFAIIPGAAGLLILLGAVFKQPRSA